jgi:hypothetical protein
MVRVNKTIPWKGEKAMSFFWELFLTLLGFGLAGLMFSQGLAEKRNGHRVYTPLGLSLLLFAWFPVRVCTYWLWQPLTGHASSGYPGYYWWGLLAGVLVLPLAVGSNDPSRRRTLRNRLVTLIGLALVILPVFYIGWFGLGSVLRTSLWLAGLALLALVVTLIVRLRKGNPQRVNGRRLIAVTAVLMVLAAIGGAVFLLTGNSATHANAAAQKKAQQDAQQLLTVDPTAQLVNDCNTLVAATKGGDARVVSVSKLPAANNGTRQATLTSAEMTSKTVLFTSGANMPADKRITTDAVNTPLAPKTLVAAQTVVCQDPGQAGMDMNGLGRLTVAGKTIAELNPWMHDLQGDPKDISTWAQRCWDDAQTHLQCAKMMAYTAALLGRFHNGGVVQTSSTWNYHLTGDGLSVALVPAYELNPKQEQHAFFIDLSVTEKTSNSCILRVGINVGVTSPNGGDQRLAGLPCTTPGTPTTPPTTPSTPPSGPPSGPPSTPPSGPPTTTPPPTHTPSPSCTPTPGVESCGKHQSYAPTPSATVKLCPAGEHLNRAGTDCVANTTPAPTTSSAPHPTPTHSGSGPTIAPPTESPAPPSSTATHTAMPTPPPPPPAG